LSALQPVQDELSRYDCCGSIQSHFTVTPRPSSLQRIVVQADSIVHPDESEYRCNPADHPLVVDGMYAYPFFFMF
jgi:hypothetical protein